LAERALLRFKGLTSWSVMSSALVTVSGLLLIYGVSLPPFIALLVAGVCGVVASFLVFRF
jgi:hypothetical protein